LEIDALLKNDTLHVVDLGQNKIGDYGAKLIAEAIKVNRAIQHLDLFGNSIGGKGVYQHLIRFLFLESDGLDSILEALKFNKSLEIISLNNCDKETWESVQKILHENYVHRILKARFLLCSFLKTKKYVTKLKFDKMILTFYCIENFEYGSIEKF
jgi:hypothetical protein